MPNDLTADLQASLPGHADAVQDYTRATRAHDRVELAVELLQQASRLLAATPGGGHAAAALHEALQQARVGHERVKLLLPRLARRT